MNGHPSEIEIDWMLRFQRGDESGFVDIVKRYEKPLINFATKYVADQSLAEDMAQDVFVEIYRRKTTYKPTGKLSTWIFTIAAHRCLNEKRQRKKFVNLDEAFAMPVAAPTQLIEIIDLQSRVQQALLHLPETQRIAMLLAKYEDMPLMEIAKVMKTSEGAVKQLLHRAKENLKTSLSSLIQP